MVTLDVSGLSCGATMLTVMYRQREIEKKQTPFEQCHYVGESDITNYPGYKRCKYTCHNIYVSRESPDVTHDKEIIIRLQKSRVQQSAAVKLCGLQIGYI